MWRSLTLLAPALGSVQGALNNNKLANSATARKIIFGEFLIWLQKRFFQVFQVIALCPMIWVMPLSAPWASTQTGQETAGPATGRRCLASPYGEGTRLEIHPFDEAAGMRRVVHLQGKPHSTDLPGTAEEQCLRVPGCAVRSGVSCQPGVEVRRSREIEQGFRQGLQLLQRRGWWLVITHRDGGSEIQLAVRGDHHHAPVTAPGLLLPAGITT
jgi:hypothetical protein